MNIIINLFAGTTNIFTYPEIQADLFFFLIRRILKQLDISNLTIVSKRPLIPKTFPNLSNFV